METMELVWKDVVGYGGEYEVSNLGHVRSVDRMVKGKANTIVPKKGKLLKPAFTQDGYLLVGLSSNNKLCTYTVHILVANSFLKNKIKGTQVNHIDGNKTNNCYSNLEWCTAKENIHHAFRTGLRKVQFGKDAPRSKKVIDTVSGTIYDSATIAATELNLNPFTLRSRLNGSHKNFSSLKYL